MEKPVCVYVCMAVYLSVRMHTPQVLQGVQLRKFPVGVGESLDRAKCICVYVYV